MRLQYCSRVRLEPAREIRVNWDLYKGYSLCFSGRGYIYNGSEATSVQDQHTHRDGTGNTTKPPCGAGDYQTLTYSHVLNGGAWLGGSLYSQLHYLPTQ